MLRTWQDYDRFAQPRDEDDNDNFEAIERAAETIEDAVVEVEDDDYRHALALVIARDLARSDVTDIDREIARLSAFVKSSTEQFRFVSKIYAEG